MSTASTFPATGPTSASRSRSANQLNGPAPPTPFHVCQPTAPSHPTFGFAPPPSAAAAAAVLSFEVKCETRWGDTVVLVGSTESFGGWQPARGQRLHTDAASYPLWRLAELQVPADLAGLEYKVVILRGGEGGAVEWEPIDRNRRMSLGGGDRVDVALEWGSPDEQHTRAVVPEAGDGGAPMHACPSAASISNEGSSDSLTRWVAAGQVKVSGLALEVPATPSTQHVCAPPPSARPAASSSVPPSAWRGGGGGGAEAEHALHLADLQAERKASATAQAATAQAGA